MPLALKQLSALYLSAATAYTAAFVLSHNPALADRAGEASVFVRSNGTQATTAMEDFVVKPAWRFAGTETRLLGEKLVAAVESPFRPSMPVRVVHLPATVQRVAAHIARHSPLHVAAKAQVTPSLNSAPHADDQGLRLSEGDVGSSTGTPHVLPPAQPVAAPTAKQQTTVAAAGAPYSASTPPQQIARADHPQIQLAPQAGMSAPLPDVSEGPDSVVPNLPPPSTEEIAQVEARLKDSLTSEMLNNFELFLYVSKAEKGPVSQRMFVFQKEPTGDLALAYNWPVSTGRERVEYNSAGQKLPSFTPAGYYELDPHRLYKHYTSGQWGEPMPFAMFFNWQKHGEETGLAIHSATGDDVALLGSRASAGCIRLPPEAARTLFGLIKTKYRGLAPRFAIDNRTGTMSNDGIILHDSTGKVQLADGYKVLVFIEDYGGENVVAAMY
jgi:lipoprotein-anchoring transpeptidase ErfK/SrfK